MVTKRGLSRIALFLGLSLAVAIPAFPQGNDAKDWQAIQDQKDQKKKADLLDAFIKKYPTSTRRPAADLDLIDLWIKNNDNAKILPFAEAYKKEPPSPDPAAKTKVYYQAMLVAYSAREVVKSGEFGVASIEADPENFQALYFMGFAGLPNPEKAFEYSQKALTLPKPAALDPKVYATYMGRLHNVVAKPLMEQRKFAEARDHLEAVLKVNPNNQEVQFLHGFANVNLMGDAAKAARDANDALIRAMNASNNAEADALKVKQENSQKEALELRDIAIDSLAKALAIGGSFSEPAKPLFESLYQNKNRSLEGADALIAQKKSELGL